jgi:hypothetical protein
MGQCKQALENVDIHIHHFQFSTIHTINLIVWLGCQIELYGLDPLTIAIPSKFQAYLLAVIDPPSIDPTSLSIDSPS